MLNIDVEQVLQDSMKKKELKPVDHDKIDYIIVRKNLYIIPKALANASEQEVSTASLIRTIEFQRITPPWDTVTFSATRSISFNAGHWRGSEGIRMIFINTRARYWYLGKWH